WKAYSSGLARNSGIDPARHREHADAGHRERDGHRQMRIAEAQPDVHGVEGAGEAADHRVEREPGPELGRGAAQIQQVAEQRNHPQADRQRDQQRMNRSFRDAGGDLHRAAPSSVDFHLRSPIAARRLVPDSRAGGAAARARRRPAIGGSTTAESGSFAPFCGYLSRMSFFTAVTPFTARAISTAFASLAALSTKPLSCTTLW